MVCAAYGSGDSRLSITRPHHGHAESGHKSAGGVHAQQKLETVSVHTTHANADYLHTAANSRFPCLTGTAGEEFAAVARPSITGVSERILRDRQAYLE